jgi:hypothetical protein
MKKPFKLKYKSSAFPFKGSPVKELQTESGEKVVEVDDEGEEVESENINVAKGKMQAVNKRTGQIYTGPKTIPFSNDMFGSHNK